MSDFKDKIRLSLLENKKIGIIDYMNNNKISFNISNTELHLDETLKLNADVDWGGITAIIGGLNGLAILEGVTTMSFLDNIDISDINVISFRSSNINSLDFDTKKLKNMELYFTGTFPNIDFSDIECRVVTLYKSDIKSLRVLPKCENLSIKGCMSLRNLSGVEGKTKELEIAGKNGFNNFKGLTSDIKLTFEDAEITSLKGWIIKATTPIELYYVTKRMKQPTVNTLDFTQIDVEVDESLIRSAIENAHVTQNPSLLSLIPYYYTLLYLQQMLSDNEIEEFKKMLQKVPFGKYILDDM